MIAEIIIKKAKQNGVDGFVFVEFKNILSNSKLPREYNKGTPMFYSYSSSHDIIYCWPTDEESKMYVIGDFISKENFHKLISILKEAGQRLTNINKKLKENWISDKKIIIKI